MINSSISSADSMSLQLLCKEEICTLEHNFNYWVIYIAIRCCIWNWDRLDLTERNRCMIAVSLDDVGAAFVWLSCSINSGSDPPTTITFDNFACIYANHKPCSSYNRNHIYQALLVRAVNLIYQTSAASSCISAWELFYGLALSPDLNILVWWQIHHLLKLLGIGYLVKTLGADSTTSKIASQPLFEILQKEGENMSRYLLTGSSDLWYWSHELRN